MVIVTAIAINWLLLEVVLDLIAGTSAKLARVVLGKGDLLLAARTRRRAESLDARLDDLQVAQDVVLAGRESVGVRQTGLGLGQLAALDVHHAQVVQPLDVDRVQLEDALVALEGEIGKMGVSNVMYYHA